MKEGWKVCGPLYIKEKWCKGCGICVEFCPKKILTLGEEGTVKQSSSPFGEEDFKSTLSL